MCIRDSPGSSFPWRGLPFVICARGAGLGAALWVGCFVRALQSACCLEQLQEYSNYGTRPILPTDSGYFGPNVTRICALKARMDPHGLFGPSHAVSEAVSALEMLLMVGCYLPPLPLARMQLVCRRLADAWQANETAEQFEWLFQAAVRDLQFLTVRCRERWGVCPSVQGVSVGCAEQQPVQDWVHAACLLARHCATPGTHLPCPLCGSALSSMNQRAQSCPGKGCWFNIRRVRVDQGVRNVPHVGEIMLKMDADEAVPFKVTGTNALKCGRHANAISGESYVELMPLWPAQHGTKQEFYFTPRPLDWKLCHCERFEEMQVIGVEGDGLWGCTTICECRRKPSLGRG
eukprot:TRINITY_DN7611_c0_g1_i1.p1 TRINITY_DN7611_c0_g1~~TRINITY_DN7611_c0_g1_i1.p1  ORF type:complete len:347 (+),score=46.14 TRINITY_DN7611_c0_g1_i1:66-1106(+)